MTLSGIHHITALAGDAQANIDFYTQVLGLRVVKRTVNYDDPGTHHFYYGDAKGTPGSLLTFFPWGRVRRPRKGSGQVVAIAMEVPAEILRRVGRAGGSREMVRFGDRSIVTADPDGLELELFEAAPGAPPRVRGVTMCVRDFAPAQTLLEDSLGFARRETDGSHTRLLIPGGGFLDLLHEPGAEPGTMGAGIVHHVALGVADEAEQLRWRARLIEAGLRVSLVRDRTYFRSIYFRPPGQTLLEIATREPGFTIDESEAELGSALRLPVWLEQHRADIERRLSQVNTGQTSEMSR